MFIIVEPVVCHQLVPVSVMILFVGITQAPASDVRWKRQETVFGHSSKMPMHFHTGPTQNSLHNCTNKHPERLGGVS